MNRPLIDGNPHWKSVQDLATYFQLIDLATNGEGKVAMATAGCNLEDNLCGTPACHAGWYGVFQDGESNHYSHYKETMATELGFAYSDELEDWAMENPELWGNKDGRYLFCCRSAFGVYGEPITLSIIANHWWKVAKRLWRIQGGAK
jgi:hypothetical protein